jgi:DNA replication protein DnaC
MKITNQMKGEIMNDPLLKRAQALKLYGLIAHWDQINETGWINDLILWEETERAQRSLERRLSGARIGRFKPLAKFDWSWPKKCDREATEELMHLDFLKEATNVIFCGPSTIAKNIAHQAILRGHTALFITAGQMLNELAAQDGDTSLRRRIKHYAHPQLLIIDELGYLSYSNRHADLLFEIISRRYEEKSTIVTTNKAFNEWGEIFPNASCVASLIDRLVHNSEIINIEADSFRVKESKERNAQRKKTRMKNKSLT